LCCARLSSLPLDPLQLLQRAADRWLLLIAGASGAEVLPLASGVSCHPHTAVERPTATCGSALLLLLLLPAPADRTPTKRLLLRTWRPRRCC
jgi:hypothetical protein